MASLDFEYEEKAFREYYYENLKAITAAADSFRILLSALFVKNDAIQSVGGRIKDCSECIDKFKRKYRSKLEEDKIEYEIKDHITDLIGLRIICLYEPEISEIRKVLQDNFQVIDVTDKISLMDSTDDQFGYKGLHMDLKLNADRAILPEYQGISQYCVEVQIRTIIQDAWSVLDHKIKYKKSIPPSLKRRINRLAALFEVADDEFLRVKNETSELAQKASENIGTIEEKTEEMDVGTDLLDVFYFIIITESEFPGYVFHDYKIDGFVQEINNLSGGISINDFWDAIKNNLETIKKYRVYESSEYNQNLNPYTMIRHALYLFDKNRFKTMLFERQRNNFEKWLTNINT